MDDDGELEFPPLDELINMTESDVEEFEAAKCASC